MYLRVFIFSVFFQYEKKKKVNKIKNNFKFKCNVLHIITTFKNIFQDTMI
jgi:hypothetical protein